VRLPVKSLKAVGGEMYAHIFENELTGLARNLFWSVSIDFAPLHYAGSEFRCGVACEWIPWTARDWRELDGEILDVIYNPDGTVKSGPPSVEASFYMTSHDLARRVGLKLKRNGGTKFAAAMDMIVNFRGYAGGDEDPNLRVSGQTEINYRGVIVVKNNLSPKPTTEAKVLAVAEKFIDLAAYRAPVDEEWRWVFQPKAFRS
jgi:hypothetical protein